MTRIAIIGGGIAGLSLAYELAKKKTSTSDIFLFDSDSFAQTCALRSTAIVAPRGVTTGHSPLGDLIVNAFKTFHAHVSSDKPQGVSVVPQFTGALTKLDAFKQRYPKGELRDQCGPLTFHSPIYFAQEEAFLIHPPTYLGWLKDECGSRVKFIQDFVVEISEEEKILTTQNGANFEFEHLVLAAGVSNPQWSGLGHLKISSKQVHGAYLEFSHIDWGEQGFSLTLEGENLIYNAHEKLIILGSTTENVTHVLPGLNKLKQIHLRLQHHLERELPDFSLGKIIVGQREKASKREPFLMQQNDIWAVGGMYKNGYSLGLHMGREIAHRIS